MNFRRSFSQISKQNFKFAEVVEIGALGAGEYDCAIFFTKNFFLGPAKIDGLTTDVIFLDSAR